MPIGLHEEGYDKPNALGIGCVSLGSNEICRDIDLTVREMLPVLVA